MKKICFASLSIIFFATCIVFSNSFAQATDYKFFDGKTITIVVPHGAGGGFDTYARMIAPYLKKHIPGSTVVVNNVTGAGGLIGRNQVYTAKPDGTTIGITSGSGMLFAQWSGLQGVKYDISKFTWIGRIAYEVHVMAVSGKSPFKTFEDLKKANRVLRFGFSGVGSDDYYAALIFGKFFGLKIDPVTGYSGSREANLAAVKGEVDGIQVEASSLLPLFKSGDLRPVLAVGTDRSPDMPDVPTAIELGTTKEIKDVTKAITYAFQIDRIIFATPGIPAPKVAALREAFKKTINDSEFKEMTTKSKRPIFYLDGDELEKLVKDIFTTESLLKPQVAEFSKISK